MAGAAGAFGACFGRQIAAGGVASVPPAWANALRGSSTPEAAKFLKMYDEKGPRPETVAVTVSSVE